MEGTGNEDEDGNVDVDGDGDRNGNENGDREGEGDENGEQDRGERESPGYYDPRSDSRGGAEDAIKEITPTGNHQSQLQDITLHREHCIMSRIRAQGREAKDNAGEGGERVRSARNS